METMNIPERCRDEQGYLIHQHLMTDIPYGCRTVAKVGCGFMAVYNAARYFAQPVTETEVWQFFHDRVFLRGVFGTSIGHVCRGVYRFGMKITGLRYRDLKDARAGILWYHTGRSRHYVLVSRCPDGRYAFPNSSAPGPMTFPDFYNEYVKHLRLPALRLDLPVMFTVTVDKRNKPPRRGKH